MAVAYIWKLPPLGVSDGGLNIVITARKSGYRLVFIQM